MGSFRHFRYGSGELFEKLSEIEEKLDSIEVEHKGLSKVVEEISDANIRLRALSVEQHYSLIVSAVVGLYGLGIGVLAGSYVTDDPWWKLPFFVLTVAIGIVAYHYQKNVQDWRKRQYEELPDWVRKTGEKKKGV